MDRSHSPWPVRLSTLAFVLSAWSGTACQRVDDFENFENATREQPDDCVRVDPFELQWNANQERYSFDVYNLCGKTQRFGALQSTGSHWSAWTIESPQNELLVPAYTSVPVVLRMSFDGMFQAPGDLKVTGLLSDERWEIELKTQRRSRWSGLRWGILLAFATLSGLLGIFWRRWFPASLAILALPWFPPWMGEQTAAVGPRGFNQIIRYGANGLWVDSSYCLQAVGIGLFMLGLLAQTRRQNSANQQQASWTACAIAALLWTSLLVQERGSLLLGLVGEAPHWLFVASISVLEIMLARAFIQHIPTRTHRWIWAYVLGLAMVASSGAIGSLMALLFHQKSVSFATQWICGEALYLTLGALFAWMVDFLSRSPRTRTIDKGRVGDAPLPL